MTRQSTLSPLRERWRHLLLAVVVLASFAPVLSLPPLVQDPDYHHFADARAFFGVPNFFNVASNVFFLLVGVAGLRFCLESDLGRARSAWIVLFAGVALVSVGSAAYHWNPNDATLVWDRLPIAVAFMALFAALLGEHAGERLGELVLAPALLLGVGSVLWWAWFDDLRPYVWVQLMPMLAIPTVMILFRARYSQRWLLAAALGAYALAKLAELDDRAVFAWSRGLVGGHALKHVLSALGCFAILVMLRRRRPLP